MVSNSFAQPKRYSLCDCVFILLTRLVTIQISIHDGCYRLLAMQINDNKMSDLTVEPDEMIKAMEYNKIKSK